MPETKLLSIVIPAYNEASTIRQVVETVRRVEIPGVRKEIVVVDDGSTDGTGVETDALAAEFAEVFAVRHESNRGKGASLRSGFEWAKGDVILVQDADLEYEPDDYQALLRPILEDRADVVYGSRFHGAGPHRVVYYWHYLGNRFLTTLSNMLTNINLSDMEVCYKVFRRDALESITLEEDRFGFEPEVTAKVARLDVRIYEVGVSYHGRTYDEGKKIGWKDGIRAIYCILKYNLFSGRRAAGTLERDPTVATLGSSSGGGPARQTPPH